MVRSVSGNSGVMRQVLNGVRVNMVLALALSFFIGCGGSRTRLKVGQEAGGEVVEAEGLAPYNSKDMILTKRASLVDAQRNAIEKAVGVFVSAKTLVEKAVAIENNILARTDGYIKKFDVLAEKVDGDLYVTRIRALVALKDLEADLKEMALLRTPELKRPQVTVSLVEEINKQKIGESVAASAMEKSLIEQGFNVVSGDRAKEAELAISGKASAYPFQSSGLGGFISYRARMSVQAVKQGSNNIVLSLSKEASGLGGNEELAGFKALETVGGLVGSEMATQLAEQASKSSNLLIYVEGVKSFSDADRVKKHLGALPGVSDLVLRSYDEEMAQFEALLGSMQTAEFASYLEKSQTLPLQVLEAKSQIMRLKLN